MKKRNLLMLPCIAAVAIATFVGKKSFESNACNYSGLLMQNVEALATGTDAHDDCHYNNGYTSFSKHDGGAYDCCRVWVNKAPNDEHCR